MQLEMVSCPKCGNDFPKKRKELGYHVCVNCSTVKPVVGITTVEGTGDHTYNDLLIMDQDQFRSIAEREAVLSGKNANLELLDLDIDEDVIEREVKEKISSILDDDDTTNIDDEETPIEGIDY